MPVTVQCVHCNAIMELDEAFRGGVCRCSTCGTLLQVPKASGIKMPRPDRPAAPSSTPQPAPTQTTPLQTTDLGGSSSGLRSAKQRIEKANPIAPPVRRNQTPPPAKFSPAKIALAILVFIVAAVAGYAVSRLFFH